MLRPEGVSCGKVRRCHTLNLSGGKDPSTPLEGDPSHPTTPAELRFISRVEQNMTGQTAHIMTLILYVKSQPADVTRT